MNIFADTQNHHFEFEMNNANGESFLTLGGQKLRLSYKKKESGRYLLIRNNHTYNIAITKNDLGFVVSVNGSVFQVKVTDEHSKKMQEVIKAGAVKQSDKIIKAQIPGLIVKVLVEKGSEVVAGQPLLILEAMKMENVIKAPCDGRVIDIIAKSGETAKQDQPLLKIKPL